MKNNNHSKTLLTRAGYKALSSIALTLINLTKHGKIEWFSLYGLSQHLENDGLSLANITCFQNYLSYIERENHALLPTRTFVTLIDTQDKKELFILSQSRTNSALRLDMSTISKDSSTWKLLRDGQVSLMRLLNIIRVLQRDVSSEEFSEFICSVLDDVRV